jgi:hypothetical protein
MDQGVFLVLIVLTAAALAATLGLAWRTRRFVSRAVRTTGKVTRNEAEKQEWEGYGSDHPAETTWSFRPHVSFTLEDGSRVEFASRVAHPRSPIYQPGQEVGVVYERADPSGTAQIADLGVWRHTVYAGIGAVVLLLVTVFSKACS